MTHSHTQVTCAQISLGRRRVHWLQDLLKAALLLEITDEALLLAPWSGKITDLYRDGLLYPPGMKHGNGKPPRNGGLSGKMIYDRGFSSKPRLSTGGYIPLNIPLNIHYH